MIHTLAVANYRSLLDFLTPLSGLNVVTGPNGVGKSNLYRALRLLAETAGDGVVSALAAEGGLESCFWAGPETLSRAMKKNEVPVQGGPRKDVKRLKLGFTGDDFGYLIELGLPTPSNSAFALDPEIKRECIWTGGKWRPASVLVERQGAVVKTREGRSWRVIDQHLGSFDSMLNELADPVATPEILTLRNQIKNWRFYDHFRTDRGAPARQPQLGTRTPVLSHDGHDLAAAIQTIREIGEVESLQDTIEDAFPGAELKVLQHGDGRFSLEFFQPGLLRPLSGAELSDGTLRFLLWVAALLTPRPPTLMVLNEPETSLHPDLLPALARLILKASERTQVWVVSHSNRLINGLNQHDDCHGIELAKELGATQVKGMGMLDQPSWGWPGK